MKYSILFIDDEPNLLNGLQRLLRSKQGQWDMMFINSPTKAAALIEQQSFDIVVSDMRMPEMDGASLLSLVEKKSPGAVRVILSGHVEEKSIFRSVSSAHYHLSKPCNPTMIISIMDRVMALREVINKPALRSLVASLRNLPTPPDLYNRINKEMTNDHATISSIADLISEDVAMTAEVLKITNSSFFSFQTNITTVAQAVRLLGLETIRALILSTGIFKKYQSNKKLGNFIEKINEYSLTIGRLAQKFSKENGEENAKQDQVFCAAMLSVIGALVLLDANPQKYHDAMVNAASEGLEAAERKVFGASHAELGAYLLGLWGFNDGMMEAVLYQLHPSDCIHRQVIILPYLHLARVLGPQFPLLVRSDSNTEGEDSSYIRELGLTEKAALWRQSCAGLFKRDSI